MLSVMISRLVLNLRALSESPSNTLIGLRPSWHIPPRRQEDNSFITRTIGNLGEECESRQDYDDYVDAWSLTRHNLWYIFRTDFQEHPIWCSDYVVRDSNSCASQAMDWKCQDLLISSRKHHKNHTQLPLPEWCDPMRYFNNSWKSLLDW